MNQAVWHFGRSLEAALEEAGSRGKNDKEKQARRLAVLHRWLSTGPAVKRHRDPATATDTVKRM